MLNRISLKWGTLKGWDELSPEARKALEHYASMGFGPSAAMQRDTPEQKEALCALIDVVDEIHNDWTGRTMTRDEAKDYVRNYGKN